MGSDCNNRFPNNNHNLNHNSNDYLTITPKSNPELTLTLTLVLTLTLTATITLTITLTLSQIITLSKPIINYNPPMLKQFKPARDRALIGKKIRGGTGLKCYDTQRLIVRTNGSCYLRCALQSSVRVLSNIAE